MDAVDHGAWRTRMRWRLRGALTWPLFCVLTLVEGIALHLWPIAGDGIGLIAALLLAGTINLFVVAGVAPLRARRTRRRHAGSAPLDIVTDRVASVLLAAVAVGFGTLGVVHHASVARNRHDLSAAQGAVYTYVVHSAPAAYVPGLRHVDIDKPADHLYRACVPGPDPRRALCLYVQTDQSPPGVTVDPDHDPNSVVFGDDERDH